MVQYVYKIREAFLDGGGTTKEWETYYDMLELPKKIGYDFSTLRKLAPLNRLIEMYPR